MTVIDERIVLQKIREHFPPPDSKHLGGTSDGLRYRTLFGGKNLAASYQLLRQFLEEEGYGDLPLPVDAEELDKFRHPPGNKAIKLFEEYGYRHYPVKIFFHPHLRKEHTLILYLYNETAEGVLLRFHGLGK